MNSPQIPINEQLIEELTAVHAGEIRDEVRAREILARGRTAREQFDSLVHRATRNFVEGWPETPR